MTKDQIANSFISLFPQHKADLSVHLEDYGELLEHVFFAEMINQPLAFLLSENADKKLIQKYIRFIEHMVSDGDEAVQNVVVVTILEYLGDDERVLRNAFSYFSEELMQLSKQVEAFWGRRDIHISCECGRVLYDWEPPRREGGRRKS